MNNYYLTILILVVAVAAMMYFGRQKREVRKPLKLTPRLKKRIVEATIAVGVEDAAKHYEISPRTARRLRVFADVEKRTCATCDHFDLKKGQEAIQSNANMQKVTQAISPAVYTSDPTNNQSWSEFGSCKVRPGTIICGTDWCGNPVHADKGGDQWA